MDENIFYNGTKLINIKRDRFGQLPEIFVVDGNRSSGKTTFFSRWLVNRFLKHGEKFMLVYRFGSELDNVEDKFFKDIGGLFFEGKDFKSLKRDHGAYCELFLDNVPCGYAVALNFADKVKKNSHLMSDVTRMFFDEFQAQKYVKDEAELLFSIHFSISRGKGQPVRYVPVYMCCNHISSLNPYYKAWNCASDVDALQEGFYYGDGFVIEKNMNSVVSDRQKQSAFNRAFKNTRSYKHSIENESLIDNHTFVEEIKKGQSNYICTIAVNGHLISLSQLKNNDHCVFYFSDKVDPSFKVRYAINTENHSENTVLLGRSTMLVLNVKKYFEAGLVRFSSLEVKSYAFEFLMILI